MQMPIQSKQASWAEQETIYNKTQVGQSVTCGLFWSVYGAFSVCKPQWDDAQRVMWK